MYYYFLLPLYLCDMEGTKPYIICVHGNIGVGKSTYINSRRDCIQIVEKIDEWNLNKDDIEQLGEEWCVLPPKNTTLFAEYNKILSA